MNRHERAAQREAAEEALDVRVKQFAGYLDRFDSWIRTPSGGDWIVHEFLPRLAEEQ